MPPSAPPLPETLVPIIAILFGSKAAGREIGVGAIIGAPFMLGTLAFCISGIAVMVNRGKRDDYPVMRVDTSVMRRDMEYFLALYALAIAASFLGEQPVIKTFIALVLFLAYCGYVLMTLRGGAGNHEVEEADLDPCYFAPGSHDPHMAIIAAQVVGSLFLIVWGSYIFVDQGADHLGPDGGFTVHTGHDHRPDRNRTAGEVQQRHLDQQGQGHPGNRQHHRRHGLSGNGHHGHRHHDDRMEAGRHGLDNRGHHLRLCGAGLLPDPVETSPDTGDVAGGRGVLPGFYRFHRGKSLFVSNCRDDRARICGRFDLAD